MSCIAKTAAHRSKTAQTFAPLAEQTKASPSSTLSNRPFTDNRTKREKGLYEEYRNKLISDAKNEAAKEWDREEYQTLLQSMPSDAPKSFSGYRRMKSGNTVGFQKLQQKAAEVGIEI